MAKKTVSKKGSNKTTPATTHVFIAKKPFKPMKRTFGDYKEAGGIRALVSKSIPKKGATAAQVAQAVSKVRKGYSAMAALNCLRWMQSQGYVARVVH